MISTLQLLKQRAAGSSAEHAFNLNGEALHNLDDEVLQRPSALDESFLDSRFTSHVIVVDFGDLFAHKYCAIRDESAFALIHSDLLVLPAQPGKRLRHLFVAI